LTKYVSYEFFALNGVFITIFSAFIFLRLFKTLKYPFTWKNLFFSKLVLILIAIPVAAVALQLFLNGICSVFEAIQFYLVFTIPTIFVGLAIASFSFYLTEKYSYILSGLIFLFFMILPIFDFYFLPQVYFFNPLITFFPGTIYDESIEVNQIIVIYRLMVTLFSIAIFVFINKYLNKKEFGGIKEKFYFITLLIILFLSSYLIYPRIGFSTTTERLTNFLTKKLKTDNYTIHFDSSISSTEMEYIKQLHQIYYSELQEYFSNDVDGKITSFVFKNSIQKHELMGSENADVAKPWLKQIYITRESYESTLKHELAHIFAGEFGADPFRVHPYFNFALIEGIAMAAEDDYANYKLIDLVASSRNTEYELNPLILFSNRNFFVNASSIGYVNSGVFVKFIASKFGMNKIKNWYKGENLENLISISSQELDSLFKAYINDEQQQKISFNTLKYYFGRSSIFMKECPRFVANKLKEANRMYHNKKYAEALKIFEILSLSTNSPQVLYGRIATLSELTLKDSALNLLNSEINYFEKSGAYFSILLTKADLLHLTGKVIEANSLYDSLINYQITPDFTSAVLLRKWLNENGYLLHYLSTKREERSEIVIDLMNENIIPKLFLSLTNSNEKYKNRVDSIFLNFVANLQSGQKYYDFFEDKILSEQIIKRLSQHFFRRGDYVKAFYLLDQIHEPTVIFSEIRSRLKRIK
jgi:hypothetical protein